MPKGDREQLKADIDDGYTTIAHLLLEALAFSRLTSLELRLTLYLMRRSYGWGEKSAHVSLREFAVACNTSEIAASKAIKTLVECGVWERTNYQPGKVAAYTVNTRVVLWDKGCLDGQGLSEWLRQGLSCRTRVPLTARTTPETPKQQVEAGFFAPKESTKESTKKSTSSPGDAYTEEFEEFWRAYPRKVEKRKAFKNWRTRLREGAKAADIILAARNYAEAKRGTRLDYMKHPATFLSNDKPFEEWIEPTEAVLAQAGEMQQEATIPPYTEPYTPPDDPELTEEERRRSEEVIADIRAQLRPVGRGGSP